MTALTFLAINLASPYLFAEQDASKLLYESSWALLGSVIAAAGFGAQFLARAGRGHRADAANVVAVYVLAGVTLATICFVCREAGLASISKYDGLIAFAYSWGACDLIRRISLSGGRVALSATLSAAALVCVVLALASAHLNRQIGLVWLMSFAGVSVSSCIVLSLLWRAGLLRWEGVKSLQSYVSSTFVDSVTTLVSFGLAWAATQGLFAISYHLMDDAQFIETKWAFSVLGIFGIAISVQENKFQPAISHAVFQSEAGKLSILLNRLAIENVYIGLVAVVAIIVAAWVRPELGVLTCALLLIYRQAFALSKTRVYVLRASGHFRKVMVCNFIACSAGYLSAFTAFSLGSNGIAWGLAAYGLSMYSMMSLNLKSQFRRQK